MIFCETFKPKCSITSVQGYLTEFPPKLTILRSSFLFQIDAKTDKTYTYADVINKIQSLAAGLRDHGLRKGDVVCHLAFNHIDFPVIVYAVNYLGAALQTASPDYTDGKMQKRIYFLLIVLGFVK